MSSDWWARLRPVTLAAIAVGGAAGTLARVELGRVLPTGPGLPWGTFVVNVAGSFLLGAGWALILERFGPTLVLWPLFATGFCGAFTTMSALAVEVDLKIRAGDPWPAVGYAGASVVAGLAGVVLGAGLSRRRGGRGDEGRMGTFARRREPWS